MVPEFVYEIKSYVGFFNNSHHPARSFTSSTFKTLLKGIKSSTHVLVKRERKVINVIFRRESITKAIPNLFSQEPGGMIYTPWSSNSISPKATL
jgi:hypothetical protein